MNLRKQPPKGKYLFGTVRVGEKGQIVIPKEAREVFDIHPGDSIVVLGDEKRGLALMKNEDFLHRMQLIMDVKECDE